MKTLFPYKLLIFGLVVFAAACSNNAKKNTKNPVIKVDYPKVSKGNVVDTFFGVTVADPYRWLEDANSAETKAFVEAQNKVSFGYLAQIPFLKDIKERLTELFNYERFSAPFKEGGKYYYYRNDGLQNQSVLYVQDKLDGEAKVVLDPNTFSKDGTVSLGSADFSKDGRFLAYGTSDGGSDWRDIYVKDLQTGQNLIDTVRWVKFSAISWQGNGFYYSKYANAESVDKLSGENKNHQVWYHILGTKQSEDKLVFEDKQNPNRLFGATVTDDERFLILTGSESTSGNSLYFNDLKGKSPVFTPVVTGFEDDFNVVDTDGDNLIVLTNNKAPNKRLIRINTQKPQPENWTEIIPEGKAVLESVSAIGGKLIAKFIVDAKSKAVVYNRDGSVQFELPLPGIGTIGGFSGKREEAEAFFTFASFNRPTSIYKFNVNKKDVELYRAPKLSFNPDDYEIKQVFYPSKDGTKVPMFITMKKGLVLDNARPTLLYGYGGFDISVMPGYKEQIIALLEQGGVYAVANIRGGGEYGRAWHEGGTLLNKQNVFDDFIAAGEYLIANNYTAKDKLAIEGRSNGGLLVGACMTQRPDLFAVAFPGVGVLDMLRYHLFTIGRHWSTDYGMVDDSEAMFKYLYKYSPVHNCKPAAYPATLVTTADHDDRVVPAHSYKFIAALQAAHTGPNPVLIRIDTRAGHGAGKPTSMRIEEEADKLGFMLYNMNETFSKK